MKDRKETMMHTYAHDEVIAEIETPHFHWLLKHHEPSQMFPHTLKVCTLQENGLTVFIANVKSRHEAQRLMKNYEQACCKHS